MPGSKFVSLRGAPPWGEGGAAPGCPGCGPVRFGAGPTRGQCVRTAVLFVIVCLFVCFWGGEVEKSRHSEFSADGVLMGGVYIVSIVILNVC